MSNGNQAYHNTDSYSYCDLATNSNPSTNKNCAYKDYNYWLRADSDYYDFALYKLDLLGGSLMLDGYDVYDFETVSHDAGVVVSFSF